MKFVVLYKINSRTNDSEDIFDSQWQILLLLLDDFVDVDVAVDHGDDDSIPADLDGVHAGVHLDRVEQGERGAIPDREALREETAHNHPLVHPYAHVLGLGVAGAWIQRKITKKKQKKTNMIKYLKFYFRRCLKPTKKNK